jgi:hypothetical protein
MWSVISADTRHLSYIVGRKQPTNAQLRGFFHWLLNDAVSIETIELDGMRTGRGNSAPVPLRPPQNPHYLIWDRTRATGEGSRRLTALVIARPRNSIETTPLVTQSFRMVHKTRHANRYIMRKNKNMDAAHLWAV